MFQDDYILRGDPDQALAEADRAWGELLCDLPTELAA